MAPDLGYAPLLHTTFPIQLILMLCSLRCLRDPRRPTLHCDSGPFTATRDPAPSTNKTHRSMANYREPIQSTSRPRNPTRLTIHLLKTAARERKTYMKSKCAHNSFTQSNE